MRKVTFSVINYKKKIGLEYLPCWYPRSKALTLARTKQAQMQNYLPDWCEVCYIMEE